MKKRRKNVKWKATHGYAVLWGATGVSKSGMNLSGAKKLAKRMAKKHPRSEVAIDGLTEHGQFPHSVVQKDIYDRPKKKR